MSETKLMKDIQVGLTPLGARMFRNNTGMAWAGKFNKIKKQSMIKVGPGDVVIRNARPVRFGLCVGGSDLVGWTRLTIKQEYVGLEIAVFTGIEIKTDSGRLSEEQEAFLKIIKQSGGFAGVARSLDEAVEVIHAF